MEKTAQDIQKGDGVDTSSWGFNVVEAVTEKAVLIVVDASSWIHQSSKSIWIPRSLIDIWRTAPGKGVVSNESGTVFYLKDFPWWFENKHRIHYL